MAPCPPPRDDAGETSPAPKMMLLPWWPAALLSSVGCLGMTPAARSVPSLTLSPCLPPSACGCDLCCLVEGVGPTSTMKLQPRRRLHALWLLGGRGVRETSVLCCPEGSPWHLECLCSQNSAALFGCVGFLVGVDCRERPPAAGTAACGFESREPRTRECRVRERGCPPRG